jgi:hypothetical protein
MPLHTEIADPIRRIRAISTGSDKAKATMSLVGKDLAANVFDLLPAAASELLTRRMMLPTMNIVVSNVRGPDVPLYMAGARMVNFAPVSIAMDGLGLNVTGFSYHGTMWVCSVACREMMPDPAFFSECLMKSFDEMVKAAAALPEPAAQSPVAAAKSKSAKSKSAKSKKKKAVTRAASSKTKAAAGTRKKVKAKGSAPGKARVAAATTVGSRRRQSAKGKAKGRIKGKARSKAGSGSSTKRGAAGR